MFREISIRLLSGSEEECKKSMEIIQRTKTPSMSKAKSNSRIGPVNHPSAEQAISSTEIDKNIVDDDDEVDNFDSSDLSVPNQEGESLSDSENDKENDKETNSMNINISPSPILSTMNSNTSPRVNTGFHSSINSDINRFF